MSKFDKSSHLSYCIRCPTKGCAHLSPLAKEKSLVVHLSSSKSVSLKIQISDLLNAVTCNVVLKGTTLTDY